MIRRAEEHVIRFNEEHEGLIRGHFHVYIGQEATGVAVCEALTPKEIMFSARTEITATSSPRAAIRGKSWPRLSAGKRATAAGGRGLFTSPRLIWESFTPRPSSAAVSRSPPERLLPLRCRNRARSTVVFFGDGAMEEGVFYEALNIAKLWQLPLIFLMENNYRRAGRSGSSHSAKELSNVPRALNVETTVVDGGDVGAMYKTTAELVRRTRAGEGPFFVEARTHPWPGNDGCPSRSSSPA